MLKRDAQLWANRSEGDEGKEFDEPEEGLAVGSTWRPGEMEMRFTLHDLLANKQEGDSIIQGSQSLNSLVDKLQKAGFSEPTPEPSQDQGHRIWSQTELDLPKPTLNMVKAAQLRLHKQKVLAIEGDDEDAGIKLQARAKRKMASETTEYPSATFDEPETAQTWVDIAPDQSFIQVGQAVAEKMTLNRLQWTALGLVCEAMDQLGGNEDEVLTGPKDTTKQPPPAFPVCRGQRRNRQIVGDQSHANGVFHQKAQKGDGHHGHIRDGGGRDRRQYNPLCHRAYVQGQRRPGAG